MSDTMIMDALKAFLKPIIAEAMHEAGNIADTATPSETFTEPTATVQESEEDLLPEETSKVPTPEEVRLTIVHYHINAVRQKSGISTVLVKMDSAFNVSAMMIAPQIMVFLNVIQKRTSA